MNSNQRKGFTGGSRDTLPEWIYPPQAILNMLASAQYVHPIYPLAKFCKIRQADLRPDKSALQDMICAVHKRIKAGVAIRWLNRRNSWLQRLESLGLATRLILKTEARTALWLSFPGPTEVAICFHHVYGVPYLPGSALKGLSSSAMWRDLAPQDKVAPPEVAGLFGLGGDLGHIGLVDFLDGIPLATSDILTLEVMTPHHAKYYSGSTMYPHDCEGPNPVLFPVIKPNVEFEVALVCTRPEAVTEAPRRTPNEVLALAQKYLCLGLQRLGLGAKTTSGFGRLSCSSAQALQPKDEKEDEGAVETTASSGPEGQNEEKPKEFPKPLEIDVIAQVTSVEPNKQKAEAVTDDGQKLEFDPLLFVQKANIYRPDWRKQVGQYFIFTVVDGRVTNLRKKEGQ